MHEERLKDTLDQYSKLNSDISIICKDGQKIFSNSLMLGLYSPVLAQIFNSLSCPSYSLFLPLHSGSALNLVQLLSLGSTQSASQEALKDVVDCLEILGVTTHQELEMLGRKETETEMELQSSVHIEVTPSIPENGHEIKVEPKEEKNENEYNEIIMENFEINEEIIEGVNGAELEINIGQLICTECDKTFPSKLGLKMHRKIHKVREYLNCKICNRVFRTHRHLKLHEITHTEKENIDSDFRYPCSDCDKKFKNRITLKNHLSVHTGKRDFKCDVCDKSFRVQAGVYTHKKYYCKDSIKAFSCEKCPKKFTSPGDLAKHNTTHSGNKPFICDICNQAFSRAGNLRAHRNATHFFEKLFQCTVCDKTFSRSNQIKQHEMLHTDERPFECKLCANSFRRPRDLEHHTKSKHEVKTKIKDENI